MSLLRIENFDSNLKIFKNIIDLLEGDIMNFGRILTAMVTPFNEKSEVDYEKAKELALYLAENGSDGIVVCGTTGESPSLTKEEKINLFKVVVSAVQGKAKIIAGTGSNSTAESLAMTRAAEECGVDGIMLVVPYYNKPPQSGIYQHFKVVSEATKLPVMLYNVPGRTSCNMLPETVVELAKLPNIVCIKEACGDLEQIEKLINSVPDDFDVYSGDDSLALTIIAKGGCGVVSVAAHIVGNEMQEMIEQYHQGDKEGAEKIHDQLMPIFQNLFITSNPIPVKTSMNLLGHNVGGVRLPLVEANPQEVEILKDTLNQLNKLK